MHPLLQLPPIHDKGVYSPKRIREMVREAEHQGHPTSPDSYLHQMSLHQLDRLLQGKHDA